MCCFINPQYLGCFSTCGNTLIKTGLTAAAAGQYVFTFVGAGAVVVKLANFAVNETLDIDASLLNEKTFYTMSVEDADGNFLSTPTFDSFSFKTVLNQII